MNDKQNKIANEYIERLILPSDPLCPMWNRENFIFRKKAKWNYIDSCLIRALIMLCKLSPDRRILDYIIRFADAYVDDSGNIPTMNPTDFNLDNINGARNLIWLYNNTGKNKYKKAYEKIYNSQLAVQPRLECGSYWHKAIYPHQLWLDGAYMALPFLAEYGIITGSQELIADTERQLENIRRIMRDEKTGLYYHGYDETRSMLWADKNTGLSSNFWLRSIGWLCAGLADICEILPQCQVSRNMLEELLHSLMRFTLPDGTLMQLPVLRELEGNYPETSGTLLFAYSAVKSYRLGITDKDVFRAGESAIYSVTEKYISSDSGGVPILKNICLMGGLGGGNNRDGSAGYYLSEKIVENDAKGIAPFLMAHAEILSAHDSSESRGG